MTTQPAVRFKSWMVLVASAVFSIIFNALVLTKTYYLVNQCATIFRIRIKIFATLSITALCTECS
jgi:hypothetical protein